MLDSIIDSKSLIDKICRNRELKKEMSSQIVKTGLEEYTEYELEENHDFQNNYEQVNELGEADSFEHDRRFNSLPPRKKSKKLTIMDLNKMTNQFNAKDLVELLKTPNLRKRPGVLNRETEDESDAQSIAKPGEKVLKPLPEDMNPKIFLQYEDLLKQKFIVQMRLYLAEKNFKNVEQVVNESQERMMRLSGIETKLLDEIYVEIRKQDELQKQIFELGART